MSPENITPIDSPGDGTGILLPPTTPPILRSDMKYADKIITSIADFIAELHNYHNGSQIWYRGQNDYDWKLQPSIARDTISLQSELSIIKRFKQNARVHLQSLPENEWEWIFLMQHHRAMTRLLDWTERPLVALFFALWDKDNRYSDKHAALWLLDPISLNRKSGHRMPDPNDILAFGIDESLDQYLPDQVNARRSDLLPVAAIGPRNSARMLAQAGTFTVMHVNPTSLDEIDNKDHIWRLIIPADQKLSIKRELSMLGVNEYSIFPDLDTLSMIARGDTV